MNRWGLNFTCIFLVILYLTGNYSVKAQVGLFRANDSLSYSLYGFNKTSLRDSVSFSIDYPKPNPFYINPKNYTPSSNPFIFDNRSSSYYVPRAIRDELNLMMNRPKTADSMVPIIAVPLIAAQIAANYIWVQEKSRIKKENILESAGEIDLLRRLWQKNPLTINTIVQDDEKSGRDTERYHEIEKRMQILINNKLVKMKKVEKSEAQYFPAKTKQELAEIVRTMLNNQETTPEEHQTLLSVMQYLE